MSTALRQLVQENGDWHLIRASALHLSARGALPMNTQELMFHIGMSTGPITEEERTAILALKNDVLDGALSDARLFNAKHQLDGPVEPAATPTTQVLRQVIATDPDVIQEDEDLSRAIMASLREIPHPKQEALDLAINEQEKRERQLLMDQTSDKDDVKLNNALMNAIASDQLLRKHPRNEPSRSEERRQRLRYSYDLMMRVLKSSERLIGVVQVQDDEPMPWRWGIMTRDDKGSHPEDQEILFYDETNYDTRRDAAQASNRFIKHLRSARVDDEEYVKHVVDSWIDVNEQNGCDDIMGAHVISIDRPFKTDSVRVKNIYLVAYSSITSKQLKPYTADLEQLKEDGDNDDPAIGITKAVILPELVRRWTLMVKNRRASSKYEQIVQVHAGILGCDEDDSADVVGLAYAIFAIPNDVDAMDIRDYLLKNM